MDLCLHEKLLKSYRSVMKCVQSSVTCHLTPTSTSSLVVPAFISIYTSPPPPSPGKAINAVSCLQAHTCLTTPFSFLIPVYPLILAFSCRHSWLVAKSGLKCCLTAASPSTVSIVILCFPMMYAWTLMYLIVSYLFASTKHFELPCI